ncbi:MAG: A/G-specific adenine glycosylase [Planctomycetota bacterium]|jgi:A/G-specific adenine glycosylase
MPECEIPSPERQALRHALLRWYRRGHRPMPWRAEPPDLPDPYHVLLSETMLQQTQVVTVIDYFHRFIEAFPTIRDLAAADDQRVLRQWQGLGYYRRARNLHAASRKIVEEFDGQIPDDTEQLLTLPGIGPYCAGAIASIAFGEGAPVVDGNVVRVLTRLWLIDDPVDLPATTRRLWSIAKTLVPRGRTRAQRRDLARGSLRGEDFPREPGDFNQALMELGATVCTPRNPSCDACPLRNRCAARVSGDPESLPIKKAKTTVKPVLHRIVAIRKGGRLLLTRRPDNGLWASMWQMPTHEAGVGSGVGRGSPSARGLKSYVREACSIEVTTPRHVVGFDHLTSHRRVRFELFVASYKAGRLKSGAGRWLKKDELVDLPLANPQRHAIRRLLENV